MEYSTGEFGMECLRLEKCTNKKQECEFIIGLKNLDDEKFIEQYFLFSAAPVIACVKPSVLITFKFCYKNAWLKHQKRLETITKLSTTMLYEKKGVFVLLIYQKENLLNELMQAESKEILRNHDYPLNKLNEIDDFNEVENLNLLLKHLKTRFDICKFPHEIGLFLGYPSKDVKAFIEKEGRDYLCCKYWKVYHDEKKAKEIFKFIDNAKAKAVYLLTEQFPIHKVAKMLAEM